MSKRGLILVLVLLLVAGGVVLYARGWLTTDKVGMADHDTPGEAHYQCAMHPQIVSDKPGICPICQMKLQRVDDEAAGGATMNTTAPSGSDNSARTPKYYRHPMRADVVSPKPAKDEMGMDYIPVYEDEPKTSGGSDVPGHAAFTLSAERQQLIGVTKARVERRALDVEIRAVGRVAYDPKLYQAVVEYREAARSRRAIPGGALKEAQSGADAIVRGARLKLRQQGLSEEQISALTSGPNDPVELLLPGKSVWIYAQVYEYEAPLVKPGQTMVVTAPALPGERFVTKVVAVDSILDPMTRTTRVRGLVATPEGTLRPESFVDVTIRVPLGEQLAVPETAVLDTGEHQVVFVVRDDGTFEPRSVELGREAQGYYEVRSGLAEGDAVVTSANFLIDSESRFRAALAGYQRSAPPSH